MSENHDVEVVQARGLTMIGRAKESNTWVPMDGPYRFRGSNAGVRPMEMFLISLAGCTGMDVISLMDKMKVPYEKIKLDVDSERAEEHPKVYTNIHIHYTIYGRISEEKDIGNIQKAIELSQTKYCSVSAMVRNSGIGLTYDYEIRPPEESEIPENWESNL